MINPVNSRRRPCSSYWYAAPPFLKPTSLTPFQEPGSLSFSLIINGETHMTWACWPFWPAKSAFGRPVTCPRLSSLLCPSSPCRCDARCPCGPSLWPFERPAHLLEAWRRESIWTRKFAGCERYAQRRSSAGFCARDMNATTGAPAREPPRSLRRSRLSRVGPRG